MTTTEANRLIDLIIEARATIPAIFTAPCKESFATDKAAFTAVLDAIKELTR